MKRAIFFVSALIGIVMSTPSFAAVVATSANVYAGATAAIVTGEKFSPKEKDASASLNKHHRTVNAAVSVSKHDAEGDQAFDHEDVYADFSSPLSGTVDLSGNSTSLAFNPKKIAEAYNSGSSFDYDFTLTSDYRFNVQYFLSETDGYYSDNYFQLIRTSGGPPIIGGSPPDGSYANPTIGSDGAFLTPGSYEFGVVSRLGDLSAVQGPGFSAGSHIDQYDFSLASAAPEPATWALMLIGIGGIGFAFRQAKRYHGFRFKDCFAA